MGEGGGVNGGRGRVTVPKWSSSSSSALFLRLKLSKPHESELRERREVDGKARGGSGVDGRSELGEGGGVFSDELLLMSFLLIILPGFLMF